MDKEIKDSRYKTASMTFDAGLTLYLVSGEWASACLLSFYPFIPLSFYPFILLSFYPFIVF